MFDFAVLRALVALAARGERVTVVDGGFHLGSYSRGVLKTWPGARIIGFEPDPETHSAAAALAATLSEVELLNAALGAAAGQAEFFRGAMAATNSLRPRPDTPGHPYFPARAQLTGGTFVHVVALDDILSERDIDRVQLLKLDLQGGELDALRGARRLIGEGRADVIQCEVVFVRKYADQPYFWEICAHLSGHEYRLHSFMDLKIGPYDDEVDSGPRQTQWNQADAIFLSPDLQRRLDTNWSPM
jgi:FkbM family methyltransferase